MTRCDDDQQLAAQLRRIADWHHEHDRWKGIDCGTTPSLDASTTLAPATSCTGPKAAGATPST